MRTTAGWCPTTGLFLLLLLSGPLRADEPPAEKQAPAATEEIQPAAARDRGLDWLVKKQLEDGSWGGRHSVATTSFACLAFLAAADEPFDGPHAKTLVKGIEFLMRSQKEGLFPNQGHTWIHGQGFGVLALSETYGRTLFAEVKPDLDPGKVRTAVKKGVAFIAANQSDSGGWWYTRGAKSQHEGSTTVTAVQALVSARNFGIEIDESVLARGFEYLKKCQNPDGGFDYQLSPAETSMKEGTAADVATLALMDKFDYSVMMNGYKFLLSIGPAGITQGRFPHYGHFYGIMGMRLLKTEFPPFAKDIDGWVEGAVGDIIGWQQEDGSWLLRGWIHDSGGESRAYPTAFSALLLAIPEGRLSIFNRDAPKLPAD